MSQQAGANAKAKVEAKSKAAAEAKPKAPLLAKPKPKLEPQPQAKHPPLPPPHSLAAKKSAKAATEQEDEELEVLRGDLRSLSSSLAAQKGAKAKAEVKVVAWEAKVDALRTEGDVEREAWAVVVCLGNAREMVKEKEENIF